MGPMNQSEELGSLLSAKGRTMGVAESCTGGLLGSIITDVPGSSHYFLGGIIAYSNNAKIEVLGVPPETLANHGAVSAKTALAMAYGALDNMDSDIAVSITGIAGPGGGSGDKPVGTVFIAVASKTDEFVEKYEFSGSRQEIKQQCAQAAIELAIGFLGDMD